MAKRTLLAFALTFIVIAAAQYFMRRNPPSQPPTNQPQAQAPAQPATSPAEQAQSASSPQRGSSTAASKSAAATAPRVAQSETETVVESDQFRVVFTNRGAQVKSWVLKKFFNDLRQPLELVHPIAAPKYGYPLSLWTYDENLRTQLNSALYEVKSTDSTSPDGQSLRTVTFDYSENGLVVHKAFTFDLRDAGKKGEGALGYVVNLQTSVMQNGAPVTALPAWPAGFGDQSVPGRTSRGTMLTGTYVGAATIWRFQGNVERTPVAKVSGGSTRQQPMQWAGATDQYFAAVFLPDHPEDAAMVTLRGRIAVPKDSSTPSQTIDVDVVGAAVGHRSGTTSGRFFVGPKALEVLDRIHATPVSGEERGPDLEALVDFGHFFGWLAKPLFVALEWIHDHIVPNWGWAIVLMTVAINALMLPLRMSGMKSMMRMQKVKPQMDAIQAKYKKYKPTDPRRGDMNKELAELYKKEGVNPVGGCLPMLLQMPVWIAFYDMLLVAIELRHAGWLWVHDLSSPDPYYLLPILTVVTMFALQLISPQAGGDPVQQRLMLVLMPLMFGWFSYRVASGLGLYWVWSSVVGILFQVWLNNSEFGREMRATMAKREARKRS
ncbi:MAG TPA: membrane protein insertase YidC [Terriglobales bacterium]|nr:membrane protein insertase YidC [Terriglobales bacterium]